MKLISKDYQDGKTIITVEHRILFVRKLKRYQSLQCDQSIGSWTTYADGKLISDSTSLQLVHWARQ